MRGRADECVLLDGLVAAVCRGESRSLVLRGEAGIGKTALLQYLIESASELTVVRAVGVKSEMELAFAGLHPPALGARDRVWSERRRFRTGLRGNRQRRFGPRREGPIPIGRRVDAVCRVEVDGPALVGVAAIVW